MEDILQFKKIEEKDKPRAGIKAYNLASIKEYTNVPNGFVLTRDFMKRFLDENGFLDMIERFLSSLMINNENIIPVVNLIQRRIIHSRFPKHMEEEILEFYESLSHSKNQDANQMLDKRKVSLVSVRNGEWTENSDNIYQLNIIGNEKLLEAIRLAFASNFTSKRILEKRKAGKDTMSILESSINPVIVQLMQQVQRSGISISFNPENSSGKEMVIRASFGLGIAKDDPNLGYDEYIINHDYEVLGSKIGDQQYAYEKDIDSDNTVKYMLKENSTKEKLNQTHIKEIGSVTRKLARILGSEMLIEWGFSKEKLIIFDAKPLAPQKINHEMPEYAAVEKADDLKVKSSIGLQEYGISGQDIEAIESIDLPEGLVDASMPSVEEDIGSLNFEEPEDVHEETVFQEASEEVPENEVKLEVVDIEETQPEIQASDAMVADIVEDVSQSDIADTEEGFEKPVLEYEEKAESIVTLDDFEEQKEDAESQESDFGYNFTGDGVQHSSEEDIVVDLDEIKGSEEDKTEPHIIIDSDESDSYSEKMALEDDMEGEFETSKNTDFAQQLLDEDFDDLDDETELENKAPIVPPREEKIAIYDTEEDASFFDTIDEKDANPFNHEETRIQEEFDETEFIAPIIKDEPTKVQDNTGTDFFRRMEVEDDGDFIFTSEQKKEKQAFIEPEVYDQEPMKKAMPAKSSPMIEKAFSEASNVVITCDAAILNSLKDKYREIFGKEPHNYFMELIDELKAKTYIPYDSEIKRVRNLREKYLSDYKALSTEEIMFCLDISKKFTSEF